jgi:tRNA-dihydrouridine synthase C
VNRSDGGAALLKNPRRVFDVVSAVRMAVPKTKTVSAKVRLGFSDKNQFLEIGHAAAEGGAAWLTVHARTRDEGYRPPAHWEYIARIREAISIPVIANGDIWSLSDYERCRAVTGCTAVMLGRGAIRSPELALRAKGLLDRKLAWQECLKILVAYTTLLATDREAMPWKTNLALCRFKQWLKQFRSNHPEAVALFELTKTINDYQGLMTVLEASSSVEPVRQ